MKVNKNTLKIRTLGRFEVKRGEIMISSEDQRLSKRWRLFQLLITYKGQTLPTDQIFNYLGLEESVNPGEALKSLVFQLRKTLKGKIPNEPSENYIICSAGNYRFNESSDYWLDIEEFEELIKKAQSLADDSTKEAISYYQKALSLYQGNFLAEVPNSFWASSKKKKYREMFLEAMLEANNLMRKMGLYKEAWELCEDGLRIVPLEEQLHTLSLQSLIDSNKTGLALIQYEEAALLFRENNLDLPPELKKMGETLKNKLGLDPQTGDLLNRLKSFGKGNGAVISELETFSTIYQIEKNRTERAEKPGFLVFLDLKGNLPPGAGGIVSQEFQKILMKTLRKGDVICKWGDQNFLALLNNTNQTDIEAIIGRLRERIPPDWKKFDLNIESKLQKI